MFRDFRPLPLLRNPHVQTILAVLLNDWQRAMSARRRLVRLPDGDRLQLFDSCPRTWAPGRPVVLLVHGLSGCHRSGYLVRLARLLLPCGMRVLRMDLRGAGASMHLARSTYNAACSGDVRTAAAAILRWCPGSPLALVGFSLGGNIVLKLAGEAAARPLPGLIAVAAVNPPIDLEASCAMLSRPPNRFYDRFFARQLSKQALQHVELFPDLPRPSFPRNMTLRQFDELYTAPRGGYADALEYYRQASALPLVPRIALPTLILSARDDPFVAVEPIAALQGAANLHIRLTDHGGHLGYLGADGRGGIHWAERHVAAWLTSMPALT